MKTKVKKNKINFKGKIVNIGVEVNLGSNPPDERRIKMTAGRPSKNTAGRHNEISILDFPFQ